MQNISEQLELAINNVFATETDVELDRPDVKFGDWSTNVALRLAKQLGKQPNEVAEQIKSELSATLGKDWKIEVAGPGFINITAPDSFYSDLLNTISEDFGNNKSMSGQKIIVEYTDPNPFKEMHIGHTYTNVIGEAIARLHEAAGAEVVRANYQGDVGRHVAISIWGMRQLLDGADLESIAKEERASFLGKAYAHGSKKFAEDESVQAEVKAINKQVFNKDPEVKEIYEAGRQWSLDFFETQYARLGTKFDSYYFESVTSPIGLKSVNDNRAVFAESDGAVVFKGEDHGLHTRVFITSEGFPTYEAKELGLALLKQQQHDPDKMINITGNEIDEYFRVVKAALGQFNPELADKINHISHGMVRLPGGKMSSRSGDVVTNQWLLDSIEDSIKKQRADSTTVKENALAAIKYDFLKHRIGTDFVFDIDESISLEGNTGPYLQYALVRAKHILKEADQSSPEASIEPSERILVRQISLFPEVILRAVEELAPQQICTYLYQLAQEFNRFYENNRVIGDEREAIRAKIVKAYELTMSNGFKVLNLDVVEKM